MPRRTKMRDRETCQIAKFTKLTFPWNKYRCVRFCRSERMKNMDDREELIGRRAYAIWENEGRPEGQHERHWEQARRDMSPVTPINETGVVQNESEPGALSALPMGKRSVRHPLLGEPIGGSDARS